MGGQRHSKNAGTMGVEGLTYHEKKALGFGTVQQRLGKVLILCYTVTEIPCAVVQLLCSFTTHACLKLLFSHAGLCGQLL